MKTLLRRALPEAGRALRSLGERPAALLVALVAVNALIIPYAGLGHDARLYAAQVLHRLGEPWLQGDLFFRYGSQDQYSLFSTVVAPLAAALGVGWTFFLLYLPLKALQLWGMMRLVRALIPDRLVAAVALLFAVVCSMPYGAYGIFRVNEDFLTPRLITTALVLLGLERLLCGRFGAALGLMLLGALMHPIMAAPGLAVLALWWAWERLSWRHLLLLAVPAALAAAAVLAWRPAGAALFGQMDDDWVAAVRQASPYASPLDWPTGDVLNLLVPFALLLASAWVCRTDPHVSRLALLTVLVGAGGVGAAVLGGVTGYALLLQAQPYRALWLVSFLSVPLAVWTAARLWRQPGAGRLLALAVVAGLGVDRTGMEVELFAWSLPVFLIGCRGLARAPRDPGWLWRSVALSLAAAVLGRVFLSEILFINWRGGALAQADGLDFARLLLACPGPAFWTAAAVAGLTLVSVAVGFGRAFRWAAVGLAGAVQLGLFLLPGTAFYQERYYFFHRDVEFVAHYLRSARGATAPPPTVYWCNGNLGTLWLDLRVRSYYQLQQIQGQLFSRDTAREAHRRARLVSQFEMERQGRERAFLAEGWQRRLENYYQVLIDQAAPTRADLDRLCRDEAVDYAILQQDIDGLYAASNGRFFIYDCRRLRARRAAVERRRDSACNSPSGDV
jgi:hypothetical protein